MYRLLALLILLTGCMGNRVFHTHGAEDWGGPPPLTVLVEGEGVLSDRLTGFLHNGCPTLKVVDAEADLRVVLTASEGEYLSIACYRSADGRLLLSRSFIWTSGIGGALDESLKDFTGLLHKELGTRFPVKGAR